MKLAMGTAAALALVSMGGMGTALADPGHGQGRGHDDPLPERGGRGADDAPGARHEGVTPPCRSPRHVTVGYVFRGIVTTATQDSLTVDLWGANAHGRRALARATPPVTISRVGSTDLLSVATPVGTRMIRNGVTGAPRVGDWVSVKYRAPHTGWVGTRCVSRGTAVVTVSGAPAVATVSGPGVLLARVTATGPAPG